MHLKELKSLLSAHGLLAKKQLGQNFLIDAFVYEEILEAANLTSMDHVVEVGPGTGFLTQRLLEKAAKVSAIELDQDMVRILEERFPDEPKLSITNQDVLKTTPPDTAYKVVANIPYYITSPIIKHFLQAPTPPDVLVLLTQKEVAEKVCAISTKSLITIETQLFGEPELIATVPPEAFYPAPKVQSAILKITPHAKPLVPAEEQRDFLRLVKFGFTQKRKKLKSALGAGLHKKPADVANLLIEAGINPDCRAEDLNIDDWKRLLTLVG